MTISIGVGLASGIDYEDIISKIAEAGRRPIINLQTQQATLRAKEGALLSLNTDLLSLKDAMSGLKKITPPQNTINGYSSNDDVLDVAAASDLDNFSSYNVKVERLAQSHIVDASNVASPEATIAAGDGFFKFEVGGTEYSVEVTASTTLSDLATAINDLGAGVNAAIINQNDSSGTPYTMTLSSEKTGTENAISVTQNDTALTFGDIQTAENAWIKVNGVSVYNPTNTFTNVVEGLTFTAKSVSAETITARAEQVEGDVKDEVMGAVEKFVAAYNKVVSNLDSVASYDAENQKAGLLFGDTVVYSIRNMMTSAVSGVVDGLDPSGLSALSRIGVSLDRYGKLEIDDTVLEDAIENNFSDVQAIFAATGTTDNANIEFISASAMGIDAGDYRVNVTQEATQASVVAGSTLAGNLTAAETLTFKVLGKEVKVNLEVGDSLSRIIERVNNAMDAAGADLTAYSDGGALAFRTEDYGSTASFNVQSNTGESGLGTALLSDTGSDIEGTINGLEATGAGQYLTGKYGTDVSGLSLKITGAGTGDMGEITVRFGVAETLSKSLTDATGSSSGLIKLRNDSLTAESELLNDRIETLQGRLDRESERLRIQFRALEQQIAEMNSQSSFLSQQLANLAGSQQK